MVGLKFASSRAMQFCRLCRKEAQSLSAAYSTLSDAEGSKYPQVKILPQLVGIVREDIDGEVKEFSTFFPR